MPYERIRMRKITFWIICFSILTLIVAVSSVADYQITNSTTEDAWVVYATWRFANGDWPAGWRTQGYYKIAPGERRNLRVPVDNRWVYIRVENTDGEMRPPDHTTRDSALFWRHPSKAFTVVENDDGDFLKSDHGRWSLETANLYKYRNGGSHTIVAEPLLAEDIYNQAIHSVVWIHAGEFRGSGVLIDRRRKLVVTNQHVIANSVWVDVFFPSYKQNGSVNKDINFYEGNKALLERNRYLTKGKVIAQNPRTDLAIVQLVQMPATAREIQRDFSRNVENSMKKGDIVHIFGNPGERLWNWTQGTFRQARGVCNFRDGRSLAGCLQMEGDTHPGNSGGPILNGQGTLIGLVVGGTDETVSLATPTRNIKALLNTVPANLAPISAPTYPKRVFRIRNTTGVTIPYQIRWSNSNDWQSESLETGFIVTHPSSGQNIPLGYPKIRFDHIADDGQQVTYRTYNLSTALFREGNNDHAPTYDFKYNRWGNRLDLFRDALAAPSLSKAAPEKTVLLTNYPNPFNPETWIPYQLAKPAEVTVAIYAADGKLVRMLTVGHQAAGPYQSKSRAVYWDGRNAIGEPVASGVYFYTLTAGDFTATRKMLIRK